ncbi:DUF2948 family protein [Roseovarius ramblicola]|uniref:DUF2948 family protein n=1 Tax=Roseovarius ramblicola TaxID=2022336 RepID=A0ABV5HWQ0_9RHOB
MSDDATFEEGRETPLNLVAADPDDLKVISALAQDAVFPITEMRWQARRHRFALLLNRFRWEDEGRDRHGPERAQSLLVVENVLGVASQGIDRGDPDTVLSLLSVTFEPGEEGTGHLILTLAGDGAIRLEIEALEVGLRDVTRPYRAPSGKVPRHDT